LVDKIRSDGHKVESYIIPIILDERLAGTFSLQKVTGILGTFLFSQSFNLDQKWMRVNVF
jgi:hypothetical protein